MAQQPNKVPTSIGIPSGAPNDLLSLTAYLTQLGNALNNWIVQAANAINAIIDEERTGT